MKLQYSVTRTDFCGCHFEWLHGKHTLQRNLEIPEDARVRRHWQKDAQNRPPRPRKPRKGTFKKSEPKEW